MNPKKLAGVLFEKAKLSKDPNTQVACLIVDEDGVELSAGINGLPIGVEDKPERLQRPEKYEWITHAEANAVAFAARKGVSLKGGTAVVTALFPCPTCTGLLIQAGIKHVIAQRQLANAEDRWLKGRLVSMQMFQEAGVTVEECDL